MLETNAVSQQQLSSKELLIGELPESLATSASVNAQHAGFWVHTSWQTLTYTVSMPLVVPQICFAVYIFGFIGLREQPTQEYLVPRQDPWAQPDFQTSAMTALLVHLDLFWASRARTHVGCRCGMKAMNA